MCKGIDRVNRVSQSTQHSNKWITFFALILKIKKIDCPLHISFEENEVLYILVETMRPFSTRIFKRNRIMVILYTGVKNNCWFQISK